MDSTAPIVHSPFRHLIIDYWPRPEPIDPGLTWEASYDNDVERGKLTRRDVEEMSCFRVLRGSVFVEWLAHQFGVPSLQDDPDMHGGGLHAMQPGGWLQTHVDYEIHPRLCLERRLNLVYFLHQEWRREWGGQLLLTDAWGKPVVEIEPRPGRLVAFECGPCSYHGVREIAADAPWRISAAVYLLAWPRQSASRRRALFMPNRSVRGVAPAEVSLEGMR